MTSSKSDPFSPKPVIQFAFDRTMKTGRPTYVRVDPHAFVYTIKQPSPFWSHWKIEKDGRLFAHLGDQTTTEYFYELIG